MNWRDEIEWQRRQAVAMLPGRGDMEALAISAAITVTFIAGYAAVSSLIILTLNILSEAF